MFDKKKIKKEKKRRRRDESIPSMLIMSFDSESVSGIDWNFCNQFVFLAKQSLHCTTQQKFQKRCECLVEKDGLSLQGEQSLHCYNQLRLDQSMY